MTLRIIKTALAVASVAVSCAVAPTALADPGPGPGAVGSDTQDTVGSPHGPSTGSAPLVPVQPTAGSIIDTTALPLDSTAHWLPVTGWSWNTPWLTGVEICSPFGKPDPAGVKGPDGKQSFAPSSDVQHVVLQPGEGGTTAGWTATLSFAPYASRDDAIGALHSYKRYLEACPLVNDQAKTRNDGGVARNDPTLAHGVLVTDGFYLNTFAAVLADGVVELTYHQNTSTPQVSLDYNPSAVFAALRGIRPRGADIGFPEAQNWRQEPAPANGEAPSP